MTTLTQTYQIIRAICLLLIIEKSKGLEVMNGKALTKLFRAVGAFPALLFHDQKPCLLPTPSPISFRTTNPIRRIGTRCLRFSEVIPAKLSTEFSLPRILTHGAIWDSFKFYFAVVTLKCLPLFELRTGAMSFGKPGGIACCWFASGVETDGGFSAETRPRAKPLPLPSGGLNQHDLPACFTGLFSLLIPTHEFIVDRAAEITTAIGAFGTTGLAL